MNISKQNFTKKNLTATDDDGISMYLSFESTNDSASYRTIAGESSCLSELIDSQELRDNSTLEPQKTEELSGINFKDCAIDSTSNDISTIRTKQQQHLKGFNALSSTPSKIASPLKVKFGHNHKPSPRRSGIRPDLSTVFNNLVAEFEQEVKENVLPSDDSMPSFSKASIMQLQKKKHLSPPKAAVITPKTELNFQINSGKALKIVDDIRKANELITSPKKEFGRCQADIIKTLKALNENLMPLVQKHEMEIESNNISPQKETSQIQAGVENTLEVINENTEPTDLKMTTQSKVKMNSAVRKTICEPNLQTNRPSRIVASKRGRVSMAGPPSLAPTLRTYKSGGSGSISEEGSDIQLPPQKNYKLKTDRLVKPPEEVRTKSSAAAAVMLRKPLITNNKTFGAGRKSIAANLQNEKRPTPKRMPAVLKTTFNCATRKASRPSLTASNTAIPKRRSVLLLQSKILQSPMSKRKKFPESGSSSSGMNDGINLRIAGGGDLGINSPRKRLATRKTMFIEKPETVKFACTDCGASYHVKALLESHKKIHRAASPDVSKKMQRATGGAIAGNTGIGNTLNAPPNHQCKYCDRVFTLERTLHIHLLEHCPKIPAAERRKLDFTELEHVRKEEIPHFRAPLQARPVRKTLTSSINIKDPLANFPIGIRATAGGIDKKNDDELKKVERNISPNGRHTVNKQAVMAPPVHKLTKAKKNAAHTGIYRTPNKDIPCGLQGCKQSFKNVLEFTNHMLAHTTLDECLSSLNGPAE